ncbi:GNAT family N-acetyltransferase [Jeotgalibacillus proteolyticus]|uniref:GNAT family N-acetyltransferase n=1 Tax=Jeotgalibacillus proteolyticus TaxID=2082395 RepID=UPI003CF07422
MLSKKELNEIDVLKKICEKQDDIQLKLNEDWLAMDNPDGLKVYKAYEEKVLIGFMAVYGFGLTAEVCGMVHPAHRRKGIFSSFMEEAASYFKEKKYTKVLLNTPAKSLSGKAFLETMPCTYSFTEYQMKWLPGALAPSSQAVVRKAKEVDKELEIRLDIEAFNTTKEEAEQHWNLRKQEHGQTNYIIEHEGSGVGKLRIHRTDNQLWIYGFAILPIYQGKGIGRSALQQVIQKQSISQKEIHLEVQADHQHTLGLYQSCGFEVYHSQDYYRYDEG